MKEIKCPKCGESFNIDETNYQILLKQIKNDEYEKDISQRLELERKTSDARLRELEIEKQKVIAEKEGRIHQLEVEISNKDTEFLNTKMKSEQQIMEGFNEKLQSKDSQIAELTAKLDSIEEHHKNTLSLSEERIKNEYNEKIHTLEKDIGKLNNDLKQAEERHESNIKLEELKLKEEYTEKLNTKDNEIHSLNERLSVIETQSKLDLKKMEEDYEKRISEKNEQIEYYKDFKARQSTKMLGESLEQHCQILFNQNRALGFQNAYFEKDNDVKNGSKGDFIFRDYHEGTEYISIMFEMKNESDTTATKKKNEDFFKELDKDRNDKKCEYAVLVSMLESDNEYYNGGIVDVSYKYPKMYVIRPQFFIPIITLLKNAAKNTVYYRQQLEISKNKNIDIENFESQLDNFKTSFGRNYRLASEKFHTAIDEIDKTITRLQKIKENLLSSENNLRLANNKAEDLTIKKLTANNPTVKAMFEQVRDDLSE